MRNLLEVNNLRTYFHTEDGLAKAVDGVCFEIKRAETLSLVGESGCGKTVTALSIMGLVPSPGKIVEGEVFLNGQNILAKTSTQMRDIRGREVSMIFQEPMTSLDPVYTIGYQIAEAIHSHLKVSRKEARRRAVELLSRVEMPSPRERTRDYPHNLSGGMRQRAMIAMALACSPKLLIADEPTTALDVTIQAQILQLFRQLKEEADMSILLITHDLGIVAEIADRIAIMYAGNIVEIGEVFQIFQNPRHPYCQGLMEAIPRLEDSKVRLSVIPGTVPDPTHKPTGCAFHPRCKRADEVCRSISPVPREIEEGHWVSCHKEISEKV